LDNAGALDLSLSAEHCAALDVISKPDPRMLYTQFTPAPRQHAVFGGHTVRVWSGRLG
jgi:hypothetical protein